jgi:hypothetical protein
MGNTKFIGIGEALSHIRCMLGRPRHSPQDDGLSVPPRWGRFL